MEKKKEKIMNLNAKKIVLIVLFALVCGGLGFATAHLTLSNESENDNNQTEEKKRITYSDYNQFHVVFNSPYHTENEEWDFTRLEIMVNKKSLSINYEENENGANSLDVNGNIIYGGNMNVGPGGHFRYKIFEARDNKEYLIISHNYFDWFNYIIDENGTIIKEITSYSYELNCSTFFENDDELMFYIEDGYIYYYRYKNKLETEDEFGNSILLELIKVDINNSTITETKTGIEKNGGFGQCD